MVVKKDYVLLCENLLVDDTGKVTIVNAFDTIYVDQVPTIQPALFFVAQVIVEQSEKKDEGTTNFVLKVVGPSKKEILSNTMEVKINSELPLQKNVIGVQLGAMPLEEFGTYQFILSFDSKKIVQRDLTVIQGNRDDAVNK
jgi:hypothetical protein